MSKQKREQKEQAEPWSLIGRCFLIWDEDGVPGYQGIVRGQVDPEHYLVQYFELVAPDTLHIYPLSEMLKGRWREPGHFVFFEDEEHLREWLDRHGPTFEKAAKAAQEKTARPSRRLSTKPRPPG